MPREACCGCPAKLEVAFDLGGRAAVEPLEDPFTLLGTKPVQQLVTADGSRLEPTALLSQNRHHRLGEVAAAGNSDRSPVAGPANRALRPPPPHDDEEIIPTEDRALMLAARPDAAIPSRLSQPGLERAGQVECGVRRDDPPHCPPSFDHDQGRYYSDSETFGEVRALFHVHLDHLEARAILSALQRLRQVRLGSTALARRR